MRRDVYNFFIGDTPNPSALVGMCVLYRQAKFYSGLHNGKVLNPPTSAIILTIYRTSAGTRTAVGYINVGSDGSLTFTFPDAPAVFQALDLMEIVAPDNLYSLANFAFYLMGSWIDL